MSGRYFFVTRGRFSQRGGGLQTPPCVPSADSAATGKLPTYCPAAAPPHHAAPIPVRLGVCEGSCRSVYPARILSQASTPTPPANQATWPPPCPRSPAVQQPHSTRRAHTCSPGRPACRPVCCHGMVPTPGHSQASARPGRWQQGGGQEESESSCWHLR